MRVSNRKKRSSSFYQLLFTMASNQPPTQPNNIAQDEFIDVQAVIPAASTPIVNSTKRVHIWIKLYKKETSDSGSSHSNVAAVAKDKVSSTLQS